MTKSTVIVIIIAFIIQSTVLRAEEINTILDFKKSKGTIVETIIKSEENLCTPF